MCYHNSINTDKQHLETKYKKKLKEEKASFQAIFHASGFQYLLWPIVNQAPEIQFYNWGLVPHWTQSSADTQKIKAQTLNARIESISEKPSFKNAKRCLVPSSGFFEWKQVDKEKIPYFIYLKDRPIFSIAGIYDTWTDFQGQVYNSFSIVTTEANELMAEIHNTKMRMPVILSESQEEQWLDSKLSSDLFQKPFDSQDMQAHVISNIIQTKNANVPEVSKPFTREVQQQLSLF
jgi:putative SOS response-associated peptidase YedK